MAKIKLDIISQPAISAEQAACIDFVAPQTAHKLNELLHGIVPIDAEDNRLIHGLALDSRSVQAGDLFFAYPGLQSDGRQFISQAIDRGAVAIVCEAHANALNHSSVQRNGADIPLFAVQNLQQKLGIIASRFYGEPTKQMLMIGITGTSGKTSCSHFIARCLTQVGRFCGVIGTLGSGFLDQLNPSNNTTPDGLALQRELALLKQQGAKAVAMEVSSHGLVQGRTKGIQFDIGLFTNLSRDHLDYHQDMKQYAHAKSLLFTEYGLSTAIINKDDSYGSQLISLIPSGVHVLTYSVQDNTATVFASDVELHHKGITAKLHTPWGSGVLSSSLLGRFNLSNLLAVVTTLGTLGVSFDEILYAISCLKTVSGRMQMFGGGKKPLVVVDYAHKPDALEQALLALREHCSGELWCVFGCGGNRDQGKRQLMAQIAERHADQIVITSDNPRHEDPYAIAEQIMEGLLCPWAAEIELDRRAAIAHSISCSKAGDVVLIAGKGHESYQQIGDEQYPFSDIQIVEELLRKHEKRAG